MGPIRCPETSVKNYHTAPRNIPEERRSYVNMLGLTSMVDTVTFFLTCNKQTVFHTQHVHIDTTYSRTKFRMHSFCPLVTTFRPKAIENVWAVTTQLYSIPQTYCLYQCCKSYHDVLSYSISLPQSRRRSHLAISRVDHVVIIENTKLKNTSSERPPMAYRL
jgi:hypothetical protein